MTTPGAPWVPVTLGVAERVLVGVALAVGVAVALPVGVAVAVAVRVRVGVEVGPGRGICPASLAACCLQRPSGQVLVCGTLSLGSPALSTQFCSQAQMGSEVPMLRSSVSWVPQPRMAVAVAEAVGEGVLEVVPLRVGVRVRVAGGPRSLAGHPARAVCSK